MQGGDETRRILREVAGILREVAGTLREVASHQRRSEGTDVDAHVEKREAGIAAGVAAGVQSADERADTWLEQAGANRDEDEAQVEGR